MSNSFRRLTLLIAVAAASRAWAYGDAYMPTDDPSRAQMTLDEARAAVHDSAAKVTSISVDRGARCDAPKFDESTVGADAVELKFHDSEYHVCACKLALSDWGRRRVTPESSMFVVADRGCQLTWKDKDAPKSFLNALWDLYRFNRSKNASADEAALARFKAIADDYRRRKTKPELPEVAQKYSDQAKAAFSERRYADCGSLYERALRIAPWWPEGHYNLGLLRAEVGAFGDALTEMRKFLALVPAGPAAEQAKEKIRAWSGKNP